MEGKRRRKTLKVEKIDKSWLFGFSPESEAALRIIVGLFQTNNYAASPDNLITISDNPHCDVWIAREPQSQAIVAACQIILEGSAAASVVEGSAALTETKEARSEGLTQSANWIIQSTYPTSNFSSQTGIRLQNFGGDWDHLVALISQMEHLLKRAARAEKKPSAAISYMAIRCDIEDYKKYRQLDFRPVALSEPEQSLRYKLLLLKPIGDRAKISKSCEIFSAHFLRHVIYWLASAYVDAPSDVFADILESCAKSYKSVCKSANFKSSLHELDLPLFLTARGLKRLKIVDFTNIDSVREHQDVIRIACLLYFGCYIERKIKKLDNSTFARLIEIGLQNNLSCIQENYLTELEREQIRKFFRKIASVED